MHMYIRPIVYFFCIMLCITGPAFAGNTGCKKNSSAATLAKGNNVFAINLYKQLRTTEGNLFFSPYSIRTALSMTYAGAKGRTAEQMKSALSFNINKQL